MVDPTERVIISYAVVPYYCPRCLCLLGWHQNGPVRRWNGRRPFGGHSGGLKCQLCEFQTLFYRVPSPWGTSWKLTPAPLGRCHNGAPKVWTSAWGTFSTDLCFSECLWVAGCGVLCRGFLIGGKFGSSSILISTLTKIRAARGPLGVKPRIQRKHLLLKRCRHSDPPLLP